MKNFEQLRKEIIASQIEEWERKLDSIPKTGMPWYLLANARKEWAHGTYKTAQMHLDRLNKFMPNYEAYQGMRKYETQV